MKGEKIMKKTKLVTLTLLSLLALTSCGATENNQEGPTWWNPTTWDWTWANPTTWFDRDSAPIVSEEEPADSEETSVEPETQGKQNIFDYKLNALGVENKVTVSLNITPLNADIGVINWASDKTQIKVTKIGDGRTAEIYATEWLPANVYSTITVSESLSGLTTTGKVYALALPELINATSAPNYAIKAGDTGRTMTDKTGLRFTSIKLPFVEQYQVITFELNYKGSEAPYVTYKGIHQGGTMQIAQALTGRYPTTPGQVNKATYSITVFAGDPSNGNQAVNYKIMTNKVATGPNGQWTDGVELGNVDISTSVDVTGLSIGDITLYE